MPDTKEIKNLRSRLERWELTHLRELAAFQHTQLEDALQRAATAEAWAETLQSNAEQLQEELLQLADECGASVCLAQNGDLTVKHDTIAASHPITPPAPGQPWPEQHGTYIGISPAEGDTPAHHLVVLDIAAGEDGDGRMTWAKAVKWAEGQGDGARLPTQLEAVFAYTTSKAAFKPGWHWTGTHFSSFSAFVQGFEGGYSSWGNKDSEHRVRAFRAIPLTL